MYHALLATVLGGVVGQNVPPTRDPALTSPTVEDKRREQEQRKINDTPIAPSVRPAPQASPGGVPAVPVDPAATRYPEGAFLPTRVGRVIRAPRGDVIFAPLAMEGMPSAPSLVLQPCAVLEQLMAAVGPGEATASVSGQVFVYRWRQHLLPTAYSLATPEAAPVTTAHSALPSLDPDPAVEDLIRELEARPRGPRSIDAPRVDVEAPMAARVQDEGALLVSRRGRLVRLAAVDGRYGVAFDNDFDSPAAETMVLLPCRALERLEGLAAQRGENVAFTVSGRTFGYEGRAYLLPVLVQPQAVGDLAPRQ